MCWPSLEGGIEIEERIPKHKNGPKRKRLYFVKDHSSNRDSDEWTLVRPHSRHEHHHDMHEHPRPICEPYDPRYQRHPQWQQPSQHQIPPPPLFPPQQQMGFHGRQDRLSHHPHHEPGDEIIRIEEPSPRGEHFQVQLTPRIIEREPQPVARMPSHLRPRSRSRGRGHDRHGSGSTSLFSGSSHSDSQYGGRGRRRSVFSDDDSFTREVRLGPTTSVRRVSSRRR